MDNSKRAGFFTSSQAGRIMASLKTGKPSQAFFTYCEEVATERSMGRVINTEVKARPMLWGSLMEVVLFNMLGIGYQMNHKQTVLHKKYGSFWSGTPDLKAVEVTGEIKCYEPKKFGALSRCLKKENVELLKENFRDEYWQTVSNGILSGTKEVELIAFMPTRSHLLEIIEKVEETDFLVENGLELRDYYWLTVENIDSLPYLPDDSPMDTINQFRFKVPMEDQIALTKRMIMANNEVENILKNE